MLKLSLCTVTGITGSNTVSASSLHSDDVYASAEIVTNGYWLQKPRVGDTCLILRDGNRDFCIGILPDTSLLAPIQPGDLRIPTGHYMRSEDHQDFGPEPKPTSWLHTH